MSFGARTSGDVKQGKGEARALLSRRLTTKNHSTVIKPGSPCAVKPRFLARRSPVPGVVVGLLILLPIWGLRSFSPTFKDRTQETGLYFSLLSGSSSKKYILESMSGGVGFVDFNRDGWIDTYMVNSSSLEAERLGGGEPGSKSTLPKPQWCLRGRYREGGGGPPPAGELGVCTGDVSNDGWEDLYITNFGPNVLYVNQGDGTFRNASQESGTDLAAWSSSAAFADYDRDGDLDLYVSNYLAFDPFHLPVDSPLCRYRGLQVQCGPHGLIPQADAFFENRGDGVFRNRNRASRVGDVEPSYGMGVVWGDYDDDGDMDVFVANDSMPNFLFLNQGDGTFREVALLAGVAVNEDGREQAGMGVDFGDYDNDEDLDLIVTNFSDDTNTLYANQGNGLFSDRTYAAGFGGARLAVPWMGSQFR